MYWAIVTLTTVGYGDISPQTTLGQFIASIIMMAGYAILAVPTGIVTNEVLKANETKQISGQSCQFCSLEGLDIDAIFCKHCGEKLGSQPDVD
jgi:voltage-gated potassium channel